MAEKEGITLRQFIEELEEFAEQYGDDTEVTILTDEHENEATPTISGGPDRDGICRIRLL